MKAKTLLFAAVLSSMALVVLSSCVQVRTPLAPYTEAHLQRDLEGTWLADDNPFEIRFDTGRQGKIAWLEWERGEFVLNRGEIVAVERGERTFLTARFEENEGSGVMTDTFHLAEYRADNRTLVVWTADTEIFRDAVKNGELEGELAGGGSDRGVTISSSPTVYVDYLLAHPDALKTRDPMVFHKLLTR